MWIIIPFTSCVAAIAVALLPPATPETLPVDGAARRRVVRWPLGITAVTIVTVLGFVLTRR